MSAAVASLLAQATPQDPMATGSVGLRSTSTEDSFNTEKAKLRVSFGGQIVQVSRLWQLRCPKLPLATSPRRASIHTLTRHTAAPALAPAVVDRFASMMMHWARHSIMHVHQCAPPSL